MTAFDYVVSIILLASIVISVVRGLVKEVLSLVGWLAAFVVANRYGTEMADLLAPVMPAIVPTGTTRLVCGFAVLFIATLLLSSLVNLAIAHIIRASGLQIVDRGLGGLFGLGRGVLIVLTVAMLAGMTDLPRSPLWRDALLSGVTESAVRTLKPWLPEAWAARVNF